MKKVFQRFILLFLTVITTMLFTACASHTHTFSEEWTYNATEHWHQATCEHKNEISEKGEHTFGGWTVKTQPTETSEGLEERSCSVCGYKETRVVPKTTHVHTFSDEWSFNETEHWHNATCDHKDVVSEKTAHTYGEWEIITEAGYGTKGSKSRTCTVCGYEEIVDVPARDYFVNGEAITLIETCFDARDAVINFSTTRGEFTDISIINIKDQKVKITEGNRTIYFANKAGSLYKYSSENNFYETALNDQADIKLATKGINVESILNYILASNLDVHEYLETSNFSFALNEDGGYVITHTADTEAIEGSLAYFIDYATYVKFNELSLEIGGNLENGATYKLSINLDYKDITIPEHTHIYSEDWSYDAEGHYHEALCPDGEEKHDLEAHTFGEWIIVTEAGYKTAGSKQHVCEVCGYEEIVEIPARDYYLDEELLELIKNQFNSNIRRGVIIDRKGENVIEVHCYNNIFKVIYYSEDGRTDLYNKYTDDAVYTYESSTGYYEEKYDSLPADVVKKLFTLGGVFNTLTESSVDFDELFTIDKFEFEYDKENDAYKVTRKDVDDLITYEDAASESADFLQYYIDITKLVKFVDDSIVFVCNDEHSDYIIALGLNEIDEIIIPEHTHAYEENWHYDETSHWHNPICPDGEEKHDLAQHTFGEWEVTIEATETKAGEKKHTCDVCGYTETEVIPMTGEVFSNFVWAADYKSALAVYLLGDVEHAYAAKVEETVVKYCDKEGLITYTATHGNNTENVQLPLQATGHNWDTPTYVWNDDNTKVTATRVCKNDNTHVETETVDVTSQIIPPTCEVGGKTVLTATFTNGAFETQTKDVDIKDSTGHKYEIQTVEYNTEKDKVVLSEKCGNCNDERVRELDIKVVADINGESGEVAVKGTVLEISNSIKIVDVLDDNNYLLLKTPTKADDIEYKVGDLIIVYGVAEKPYSTIQLQIGCKILHAETQSFTVSCEQTDITIDGVTLPATAGCGTNLSFTVAPVDSNMIVSKVLYGGKNIVPDTDNTFTIVVSKTANITVELVNKFENHYEYVKATSISDLSNNSQIVFYNEASKKVSSYDSEWIYLEAITADFNYSNSRLDDQLFIQYIILEETTDGWYFKLPDGKYLNSNEAKKFVYQDTPTTKWTIVFENGTPTISTTISSSNTSIKYNSSNPRFVNYASGQQAVDIYVRTKGNYHIGTTAPTCEEDGILEHYTDGTKNYDSFINGNELVTIVAPALKHNYSVQSSQWNDNQLLVTLVCSRDNCDSTIELDSSNPSQAQYFNIVAEGSGYVATITYNEQEFVLKNVKYDITITGYENLNVVVKLGENTVEGVNGVYTLADGVSATIEITNAYDNAKGYFVSGVTLDDQALQTWDSIELNNLSANHTIAITSNEQVRLTKVTSLDGINLDSKLFFVVAKVGEQYITKGKTNVPTGTGNPTPFKDELILNAIGEELFTNNTNFDYSMVISSKDDKYTIRMIDGYYAYSNNNTGASSKAYIDDCLNGISFDANGNVVITCSTRQLYLNVTNTGKFIRYYVPSTNYVLLDLYCIDKSTDANSKFILNGKALELNGETFASGDSITLPEGMTATSESDAVSISNNVISLVNSGENVAIQLVNGGFTKDITINIISVNAGTLDDPYTIENVNALFGGLDTDSYSANEVYVSGIVKTITYNNSDIAEIVIADSKESTDTLAIISPTNTNSLSIYQNDTIKVHGFVKKDGNVLKIMTKESSAANIEACAAGTSTITIGSTSSKNVTVTIDENKTSGTNGSAFAFTVTPETDYQIDSVTVNGETITVNEGKYNAVIKGDTVIVVTASSTATSVTYTFTSKSWTATSNDVAANWTSGKDGGGFSNDGIQVTNNSNYTGANGTSPVSYNNISKIILIYNTNKSAGAGTADIKIGSNAVVSKEWGYSGSDDGRTANFQLEYEYATTQSGAVTITLNTTTNSIYLVSVQIFYESIAE